MIRTQIQLPDEMYEQAKEYCRRKEISLAELCRRSLDEYLVRWCPARIPPEQDWQFPVLALGQFQAPPEDWRLLANEETPN